ncbi:MAG: DJ-1/PfpI family protein [Candidatus Binataceae bacterium]
MKQKTVGIVLFEGFELLDVFGPAEAYRSPQLKDAFQLVMIAEARGVVTSAQGPQIVPNQSFADAPTFDLLMVPGGIGTRREVDNPVLMTWLRARVAETEFVTSICTGAGLLARAGLLDGHRATSNKFAFDWVKSQGPRVNWVAQARWVEDGKFWTSAGVSAGIDMALAIIARICGTAAAERTAARMEYEWHRDPGWDPFAEMWGRA